MSLRKEARELSLSIIETRIQDLEAQLQELISDAAGESKSSAGDKHETSRAMMQLEHEKISYQIENLRSMFLNVSKLEDISSSEIITPGAVIITNKLTFYLAESIGKIKTENMEIITISGDSPIGQAFLGQSEGKSILLNGVSYNILKVE